MAITRCPYCHAIIDENDKYCNNCGTQLLFPEDEAVEEEIPGEKILDAETEDKDYEIYEPGAETTNFLEEAGVEEDKIRTEEFIEDLEEALEEEEELDTLGSAEFADSGEEILLAEADQEVRGEDRIEDDEEPEEVVLAEESEDVFMDEPSGEVMTPESPPVPDEGEPSKDEAGADEETWSYPVRPVEEGMEKEEEAEEEETEDLEVAPEEEPAEEPGPSEGALGDVSTDFEERKILAGEPLEQHAADRAEDEIVRPEDTEAAAHLESAEDEDIPAFGPGFQGEEEPVVSGIPGGSVPSAAPDGQEPDASTFDTWELERMGRTVELGKEKVDKFIEVMSEKEKEEAEEELEKSQPPVEPRSDTGGILPPWADKMKGAPSFDTKDETGEPALGAEDDSAGDETPADAVEEDEPRAEAKEESILPRRRPSDSGIGFPERLTQAPLPFEEDTAEVEAAEEEGEEEEVQGAEEQRVIPSPPAREKEEFLRPREGEMEEPGVERIERRKAPGTPINLAVFLKAKAFDCLFLAFLWLVCVWFAARSMGATPFELLSSSGGLLLVLYLTFLLMYFFLFHFFLGETLGDRLFRKRD